MKKTSSGGGWASQSGKNYASQIVGIFSCNLRGIFFLKTSLKNQVASNEKSHVPFIHKAKRTKKKGEGVVRLYDDATKQKREWRHASRKKSGGS